MRHTKDLLLILATLNSSSLATVVIDFATIGDIGNPKDPQNQNGQSSFVYNIGKYEITNGQYTDFLNAADPTGANTRALYNSNMSTDANGGIDYINGNSNGSKYVVKAGRTNNPVVFVSFWDALRMSNWMANGQGSGSTESGTYTMTSNTSTSTSTRNFFTSSKYFVPTEYDWYKAAYYQPTSKGGDADGYWQYPNQSNIQPNFVGPTSDLSGANSKGIGSIYALTQSSTLDPQQNYLTDVGSYSNNTSYYGTYDQLGNVWEWTEGATNLTNTVIYGYGWQLAAANINPIFIQPLWDKNFGYSLNPSTESSYTGFRLASNPTLLPEPSMLYLSLLIILRRKFERTSVA